MTASVPRMIKIMNKTEQFIHVLFHGPDGDNEAWGWGIEVFFPLRPSKDGLSYGEGEVFF